MAVDGDSEYEVREFQDFLADRRGRFLPQRRFDRSETWETYRLLGIQVTGKGHDFVTVTWPDGWRKVRAGAEWQFELRAADDTAMVTGTVLSRRHGQGSLIDMRLTDAARRIVRRRFQAMPVWRQSLLRAKAAPWKPRYSTMRRGQQFSAFERERLPIVVSRLRALGWQIGEQLPTGVEILLSEQAAGWEEEHFAGDRFWVMPSEGGSSLAYGVAAGGEYPWCQWDARTPWSTSSGGPAGPSDIATEIDRVLRCGLPPGVTTWPVLGHGPAARRTREPAPSRTDNAPEHEVPVRDSLPLWDVPLVSPRHVPWQHRLVLESHPDLPPPSDAPPPRLSFAARRYEPGLWEIARKYPGQYFLPRTLSEEHQEILRSARAAARAIEDAPPKIADELLHRDELLFSSRLLLKERLLLLARTLERGGGDPEFDPQEDSQSLIGVLEARAGEAFDMALRQAQVVEAIIMDELILQGRVYNAPRRNGPAVSQQPTLERVVCDCGQSRWLLILIDEHGAIGCACGRLRWEDRLTRRTVEQMAPAMLTELRPPFDLDTIAAASGFGPFRHKW
ncbi:hypothetical protein ACFC26_17450 [Kitasatospora purpeofusca]|uniref:hypothetical protein n=1 Tax=Kitasatospora purpeofusca TaxID=67352 RepID=UPI0035E15785